MLGDGLVLSFSSPSVIQSFDVCLRLNTGANSFKVADFGYSTAGLTSIHPLGLFHIPSFLVCLLLIFFIVLFLGMKKIKVEDRESGGTWYCSAFEFKFSEARDDGSKKTARKK